MVFLISSSIKDAEMVSMFSKSDLDILEPRSSLKNLSPGRVNTRFLTDLAIAVSFLIARRSLDSGLT